MPLIVSEDQTGFIRGRHSYSNIRRLLGVIFSPSLSNSPEAIISLDNEKAFDRVEWAYLLFALRQFGLNNNFISWVRLLYTSPCVSICTNNQRSALLQLLFREQDGCRATLSSFKNGGGMGHKTSGVIICRRFASLC